MNREHWKAVLPFVQAFAEGKQVEIMNDNGAWISKDDMLFSRDTCYYRIVEPPKLRPWKREEIPLDAWYRENGTDFWRRITSVPCEGMDFGCWFVSFEVAFNDWEHSTDGGKTWHPCGVIEGGAS